MVKLIDVANKAGVSKATASLALNNSDKVNEKTLARVRQAAEELNYIPNAIGKALANDSTNAIALVVPEVNNQFFSEIVQLIQNEVKKYDYNLILCTTEYDHNEEKKYINLFRGGLVDGAIFTSHTTDNKELINFAKNFKPIVFMDRKIEEKNIIPVVKSNLVEAAEKAVQYLIDLGHTKIGYIGYDEERYIGYKNKVKDFLNPQKYRYHELSEIKKIIETDDKEKLPTAFLCYNDDTAFKLIMYLSNAGFNVPQDMSVCGIDNVKLSEIYNPPLTTVNLFKDKIVKKIVGILIKKIKGEKIKEEEYYQEYSTELIIRKSTQAI